MHKLLLLLLVFGLFPFDAEAQDDDETFAEKWQSRATRTQAKQPKWAVPMVSPFPMLAQVYRSDFTRQTTSNGKENWNLGTGKGFNLIPFANTQVDILTPGFITHGDGTADGFGDIAFLAKYRVLSANEQHGNYIVSGALAISFPTGSHKNGAATTVLTPTISAGKGFGRFAVFTSLGGGLPTSNALANGRILHSNTVAQYKFGRYFTPEVELNSTRYFGGSRDGRTQTFLSPGIVMGKFPIRPASDRSRMGLVGGVAFQTAVTHYHTYNHALVMSLRLAF
jgi:hypothetical protein